MRRRSLLAGFFGIVAARLGAEAQQAGKAPRVGILFPNPTSATAHLLEAFRRSFTDGIAAGLTATPLTAESQPSNRIVHLGGVL